MALTVTVNSVDITAKVNRASLRVEQSGIEFVATCSFTVEDSGGSVTITPKHTLTITDGGTTYFSGEVARVDTEYVGTTMRLLHVEGQDYNIWLEETIVPSESYTSSADADIIDDLFTTYRSDVNATTYVSTIDGSMDISFAEVTLRRALSQICELTGGRFYVDESKNLHYFTTESNQVSWDLSDSPTAPTSYGYMGLVEKNDGAQLVNKVRVVGAGTAGWVTDATSTSAYGEREAVVTDRRVTNTSGISDRGNAILDLYANPIKSYDLQTFKAGLRAGMDVKLVSTLLSLNTVFTARRVSITWPGDEAVYTVELGRADLNALEGGRRIVDRSDDYGGAVGDLEDVVYDTDAPSAPTFTSGNLSTGVEIDADGHQIVYIKATWGAVGDSDLDHYEIQCADNNSFNWPMIYHVQAGDTREVHFRSLRGGIDYYLRVRAVDWVGNYSAWSPQPTGYLTKTAATDTSAPAQVSGLSAGAGRTLIGLSWTANTEMDLAYYEIQRAPDVSGSPGTWATIAVAHLNYYIDEDFTDGEIAAEDTFWYRVRAVDTSGNEGTWATQTSATLSRITADHITANTITASQIAANTITASEIAANTITASEIYAGTITGTEITGSTLSAIYADMGTLTAGEIRIGTGTPGSNFTGIRLFSSYLAGYNNDTAQFYIDTSDGKGYWAGGAGVIDASGIALTMDTSQYLKLRSYSFAYSGNTVGYLSSWYSSGEIIVALKADDYGSTYDTSVVVWAEQGTGKDAEATVKAGAVGLGAGAAIKLYSDAYLTIHKKVLIEDGGTSPTNSEMTVGLTIDQAGNDDEALALQSTDVAHGITDEANTDTYMAIDKAEAAAGGARIRGYKDADGAAGWALYLEGCLGEAADTTKSTAGAGIVALTAAVKSGTGIAAAGADANLVVIRNYGTTRFIFDAEGSAHADVEWTTFAEHDDLALLDVLESTVMARDFGAWIEANKALLERLNIAHFDKRPGHAMVNWTRLAMLLVGALRQIAPRLERLERRLLEGGNAI